MSRLLHPTCKAPKGEEMTTDLARLIASFADLTVLVIGEAMLDSYIDGTTERLCREAPVPIVDVTSRSDVPGGAANTAVNVAALGARVRYLSVTGDDAEGATLRQALQVRGVATNNVIGDPTRRTLAKHRVSAAGHLLVRFDQGSTDALPAATETWLRERLAALWADCDAIIVSDYGYGILSPRIIATLADLQQRSPRVIVADAKNLSAYRDVGLTAVKPNYGEAKALLRAHGCDQADRVACIMAHGESIRQMTGARIAAITIDTDGAVVIERDSLPYRMYARPTTHARAAGAGDTFVAALTLGLATSAATEVAAELASAAAAIVVSRDGTTACTADALREYFEAGDKWLPDMARLDARLALYRQQGRRIVFANGIFDILHSGHIAFLNRAKELGDVLIVGLNSDVGVRRLKGAGRPINALADRANVLAALSCVDHIIAFDDALPNALITAIRPDIFVKGGNYTRAMLPEVALVERLGGSVHILPYIADRSTTGLIEKIRDISPQRTTKGHKV